MGAHSKIEWCDHTFNPWVGCTKVSPACDHCYAESWARRTGQAQLWTGERRRTTPANWRQPRKWDREAAAAGERRRVFCASLADVFDNQVPEDWRRDLWRLIVETPNLDWLLLTKRPQNIPNLAPSMAGHPHPWFPNVWLGTTIENREEMHRRARHLKAIPAVVHFWSVEPMLEDLGDIPPSFMPNWIICGGESGPRARPMHPNWARSLRDQCAAAGVPFFFKQWGEYVTAAGRRPAGFPPVKIVPAWMREDGFVREGEIPFSSDVAEGERATHRWVKCARIGKAIAGRHLDGREHNEFPEVTRWYH